VNSEQWVQDYVVTASGDGVVPVDGDDEDPGEVRVPKENHDEDWYWQPNVLQPLGITPQSLAAEGVILEVLPTEAPPGCEERLARYREATATPS
jgi:hypothetical protein